MDSSWFELDVIAVTSMAMFSLCAATFGYLLNLPDKKLDSKLFAGYFLTLCLYYATGALHSLTVYLPLKNILYGLMHIILGTALLFFVGFAYECAGNPYKRESYWVIPLLGLVLGLCFYLSQFGANYTSLCHFAGVLWATLIYGRKAARAKRESGMSAPINNPLRGFQKWAFINFLIWVAIVFFPAEESMPTLSLTLPVFIAYLLVTIQTTYGAIVFLNYTPQRTSFQAKVVGLVLCPLLIILAVTPFLLGQLFTTLPNFKQVNHQVSAVFMVLIPLTTLFVVVGLPRFLRSNLLSPLNQILEGVRQVDEGNLSVQLPVLVNDEVGKLAAQFNSMTSSLNRYSNQMEALVAEKTTELKEQKEGLQQTLDTLKSTQAQLIQSEKMASLGELTAGIAHEIQNPLNFVNNFSEVSVELVEEIKETRAKSQALRQSSGAEITTEEQLEDEILEDIKQNLSKITLHGKRADAIVKGMLEHSRKSTGEKVPTDLNGLAEEYLKLSYHGMRAKDKSFNADFSTDFDPNLPKVEVIPQDIGRVLLNLINNGFYAVGEKAKFGMEGYKPKVIVATKKTENGVEISVKDNGSGIPESIREKIFQPFFTTKPTGQGTGLGLSLSYDITKAHGGELRVKSKVDEGTSFIIQLPKQS